MALDLQLRDKTILWVGPHDHLARQASHFFVEQGANILLVCPEDEAKLNKFCQQIADLCEVNDRYGRISGIACEDLVEADMKEIMSRVAERFGSIDVLIDNQIAPHFGPFELAEVTLENGGFKEQLLSPLRLTSAALPFLKNRSKGRIIYLGYEIFGHGPNQTLNAASRNALWGVCENLARELQETPLTVNGVAMGVTEDYLLLQFPNESPQSAWEKLRTEGLIQPRIIEPDAIVRVLGFLASPSSQGVSGQVITVAN